MNFHMNFDRVVVQERGQIVIPKKIREILNLKKGESLILIQKGDELILKKPAGIINKIISFSRIDKDLLGSLLLTEKSLTEDWCSEEDDIWNEY